MYIASIVHQRIEFQFLITFLTVIAQIIHNRWTCRRGTKKWEPRLVYKNTSIEDSSTAGIRNLLYSLCLTVSMFGNSETHNSKLELTNMKRTVLQRIEFKLKHREFDLTSYIHSKKFDVSARTHSHRYYKAWIRIAIRNTSRQAL